jgi:hypothetical protein
MHASILKSSFSKFLPKGKKKILMTFSSLRVSCDPNTISMLTFTCCNGKYDVITKILLDDEWWQLPIPFLSRKFFLDGD